MSALLILGLSCIGLGLYFGPDQGGGFGLLLGVATSVMALRTTPKVKENKFQPPASAGRKFVEKEPEPVTGVMVANGALSTLLFVAVIVVLISLYTQ